MLAFQCGSLADNNREHSAGPWYSYNAMGSEAILGVYIGPKLSHSTLECVVGFTVHKCRV
jgi:hypothetical protein